MARTIDKTKSANIKCEHCRFWTCETYYRYTCQNKDSKKYQKQTNYWNRCKGFDWTE